MTEGIATRKGYLPYVHIVETLDNGHKISLRTDGIHATFRVYNIGLDPTHVIALDAGGIHSDRTDIKLSRIDETTRESKLLWSTKMDCIDAVPGKFETGHNRASEVVESLRSQGYDEISDYLADAIRDMVQAYEQA